MRILHVIRSADPKGGGPIEAVVRLGIEHQRSGRNVEIATLDAPDAPWIRELPFPCHALGPVTTRYGYTPALVPWLRRQARRYDVLILNGLWQYSSFGAWRATRGGSTPYVVFPHGMLDPWFKRRYPLKHAKKWMYWPWAEYRVLRDAAAVLFTSEDERRLARESFWLYRCREHVVQYGTAPPPPAEGNERRQFDEQHPEARGRRIVLFFGRVHEKKGCELLVRAFARAAASASGPWHLVLAGPAATAEYRRVLETTIERHHLSGQVTWTGMLTGADKWRAFRSADVFALPSHQENFGVAVAEALACGVPVLISDKVNIWRDVAAGGCGLIDSDEQAGTNRLLARWMTMAPAEQERMRMRARATFEQRFGAREAADGLAQLLESLG
jgi:glycosyltransferase involved in cell wall biosynthesis